MNLLEEIRETENKLAELKQRKKKVLQVLNNLEVGDKIYRARCSYGFDIDYVPLEVLEIDKERLRIKTKEETTTGFIIRWRDSFTIFEDDKPKHII
jgi:hypothetical protein